MITFANVHRILPNTPLAALRRTSVGVLNKSDVYSGTEFSASELLILGVADFMQQIAGMDEITSMMLLQKLKQELTQLSLDWSWQYTQRRSNAVVEQFRFVWSELHYVTWSQFERWWHIPDGEYVDRLPCPAIFTLVLDVPAMFFRLMDEAKRIKDENLATAIAAATTG